jgi:hydrogenase maturation protease
MWLVIGYGSSLHGDDGFGRLVANELIERSQIQEMEVISVQQLNPELAEPISKAEGAIFVDASINSQAGEVNCRKLCSNASGQSRTISFTHHCDPETLMQFAGALYGDAPPALLYTVRAMQFGLGQPLSPEVKQLVEEVTTLILDRVGKALTDREVVFG